MKKTAIAVAALFTALAPAAFAQYHSDYRGDRDYRDRDRERSARVIESRPVYEYANANQECWNPRAGHYEEVREQDKTRIGKGAAIGAVAGGVIGHQTDSNIGTGVGAVLGGIIGHQVERHNNENDKQDDLDFSRCRVIGGGNTGNVIGYDVRYSLDGREYTSRMSHDPGRRVRLSEIDR
jgi:uncharacterized protein YcfJ